MLGKQRQVKSLILKVQGGLIMQEGEKEVVHHVAMNLCEGGKVKASVKDRHMISINVLYLSPSPTTPPPLLCLPL